MPLAQHLRSTDHRAQLVRRFLVKKIHLCEGHTGNFGHFKKIDGVIEKAGGTMESAKKAAACT